MTETPPHIPTPTPATMRKRSVRLHGHETSITLEDAFWDALKTLARKDGLSVNALVAAIDAERLDDNAAGNLSSAIRVHILQRLQKSD